MNDHKIGNVPEELKEHQITKLLYVERFEKPSQALERANELKFMPQDKKLDLILKKNPKMTGIS